MSRILLANCEHEAVAMNSQVLPCNTVPFKELFQDLSVHRQTLLIAAILRDRVVL